MVSCRRNHAIYWIQRGTRAITDVQLSAPTAIRSDAIEYFLLLFLTVPLSSQYSPPADLWSDAFTISTSEASIRLILYSNNVIYSQSHDKHNEQRQLM